MKLKNISILFLLFLVNVGPSAYASGNPNSNIDFSLSDSDSETETESSPNQITTQNMTPAETLQEARELLDNNLIAANHLLALIQQKRSIAPIGNESDTLVELENKVSGFYIWSFEYYKRILPTDPNAVTPVQLAVIRGTKRTIEVLMFSLGQIHRSLTTDSQDAE